MNMADRSDWQLKIQSTTTHLPYSLVLLVQVPGTFRAQNIDETDKTNETVEPGGLEFDFVSTA
jgi:hypothetical protein